MINLQFDFCYKSYDDSALWMRIVIYFSTQIIPQDMDFYPTAKIRYLEMSRRYFTNCSKAPIRHELLSMGYNTCGHFCKHGLTLIPAWLSNHMPSKV